MPRFLDTRGNAVLSIGICGRCQMKRASVDLVPDKNFPGLIVCIHGCVDNKDPWRLPARKTEKITIKYPRPDVNIADNTTVLVTDPSGNMTISPESTSHVPQQDGNLDSLSP